MKTENASTAPPVDLIVQRPLRLAVVSILDRQHTLYGWAMQSELEKVARQLIVHAMTADNPPSLEPGEHMEMRMSLTLTPISRP